DAVEAVFAKALAVKTTDRYATAGEFWNALHGALGMAPMRGVTTTDPRRHGHDVRGDIATASTVAVPESAPISGGGPPSLVSATATNRTPGRGGGNGVLI